MTQRINMLPEMERLVGQFKTIGLDFTPGGQWVLDVHNVKQAIDINRKDNMAWDKYPNDNMARVFLNREYLVVDIDGGLAEVTDTHFILTSGTALPLTLYTTTSSKDKIHAYYRVDNIKEIPNRTTSVVEDKVDTFVYGVLFEGHTFAHHTFNDHPIATLPQDHPYIDKLVALEHSRSSHQTGTLHPVTSPKVKSAINELYKYKELDETLQKAGRKQLNKALRVVIPNSYIKKGAQQLLQIPFTYSLINDMATKLMCVAELSTQDVEKFLRFFIRDLHNMDPDFKGFLYKNIMSTLPNRDAIELYDDGLMETMEELMEKQLGVAAPIFKTAIATKITRQAFVQIDRITMEPKMFQGTYLHDRKTAEDLAPERNKYDEDGNKRLWDENVPLIENITCPYSPQLFWNENDRYTVNLYVKTEYQKHTAPRQIDRLHTNLIGRFIQSVVPKEYVDFVLRYYAYVVFSEKPPLVTLWMSSHAAGAGKSILTVELFALLVGPAATSASAGNVIKDWGDIVKGRRVLAIEDIGKTNEGDWNKIYTFIKQQSGNAHRLLDAKHGAISTEKVRLNITGSSNYRVLLDPDDRRFFCLEPAHRDPDQPNMPLSEEDVQRIGRLVTGNDYSEEVQEFMDHLNYIHEQPLTTVQELELYERAPNTVYKDKWKVESKGYSRRVVELIADPVALHSLVRTEHGEVSTHELVELYQYLVYMYHEDTHKIGLSWKWFAEFLPMVSADHKASSKQSLKDSMGIEDWAANIGSRYVLPAKHGLHHDKEKYPAAGLVIELPVDRADEIITHYRDIIQTLLPEEGKHAELEI